MARGQPHMSTLVTIETSLGTMKAELYEDKAPKTVANFLISDVNAYLNKNGISIEEFPLKPAYLNVLAGLQEDGFTHKQVMQALNYLLENQDVNPKGALEALHIEKQSNDDGLVLTFVNDVLAANPQSIADFKAGKDRALGFLVGQVMKAAKGKVYPSAVSKVMLEELKKR